MSLVEQKERRLAVGHWHTGDRHVQIGRAPPTGVADEHKDVGHRAVWINCVELLCGLLDMLGEVDGRRVAT